MKTRREFTRLAAGAALLGLGVRRAAGAPTTGDTQGAPAAGRVNGTASGAVDRAYWCDVAERLARPMLDALARRRLHAEMPVEARDVAARATSTHLEALGRLLVGLAPWLELPDDDTAEGRLRAKIAELARTGIDAASDPASPDFMNFNVGRQPLVDAAFLAQAMLRAPRALWQKLPERVQKNVVTALASSRPIQPGENNWVLFATTVEVFAREVGAPHDEARLRAGLDQHRQWYLGDGVYGDGKEFHWDYYNSYVIHPMLYEALQRLAATTPELQAFAADEARRLMRWAAIQERMITPDGSFPIVGRSTAYRCGAFQGLALAALRDALPESMRPAQARVALTAVIRRTLEAPGTWDEHGWLRLGLAGHQPRLADDYISTGSLYLCSTALLPLGLPATHRFWTDPAAPTSWQQIWGGADFPVDHALT